MDLEHPSRARSRHTSKWTRETIEHSDPDHNDKEDNYREDPLRSRVDRERQATSPSYPSRSRSWARAAPKSPRSPMSPRQAVSTWSCLPSLSTWMFLITILYVVWYTSWEVPVSHNPGIMETSDDSISHLLPNVVHSLFEDPGTLLEAIKVNNEFPKHDLALLPGKSRKAKTAIINLHSDIRSTLARITDDRDQLLQTISHDSTSLINSYEIQKRTLGSWEQHETKVLDTIKNWPTYISTLGVELSMLAERCEELNAQTKSLLQTADEQPHDLDIYSRIPQTDRVTLARIQTVISLIKSTEASVLKAWKLANAAGAKIGAQPFSRRTGFSRPVSAPTFDDDAYAGLIEVRDFAAAYKKKSKLGKKRA